MKSKIALLSLLMLASCASEQKQEANVTLITLDPGHFHAALVQKTQYPEVSPDVYVYAPEGDDVDQHLKRIEAYNNREENPTHWNEVVYKGTDFLDRMIKEKKGNVMVTAGNNSKKTSYILEALKAGINVLSDKPMAIDAEKFEMLEECFREAEKQGVLLYDIMTERFEISTILQRELSMIPEVYGNQLDGTPEEPAITKESVHHFYKNVSGNPLVRPAWYYDVKQQGEGIADVTVHLVDLVQWETFPDQIIDYKNDVKITSARHWPTALNAEQFERSTGLTEYPDFLKDNVEDGNLQVYANGEINYTLKGVNAKVVVTWDFEAPEGGGDTHYSIMRGSKASLIIRQGQEQKFVPELYIEPAETEGEAYTSLLEEMMKTLEAKYPGIGLEPCEKGWHVTIPKEYRVGHEAHFGQVTQNFLKYLKDKKLPEWEVPNMLAKYYTTTQGWKMAGESK